MIEPAELMQAFFQHIFTAMTKGRMSQIMCKRHGLGQIFLHMQYARQGTRNLRDFQRMAQSRAEMIAFIGDENLGLVFQTAKGR